MKYKIVGYKAGKDCKKRFIEMGILIGKEIEIITMQPMRGPVTFTIGQCTHSIGRGMFDKIILEEINDIQDG